MALDEKKIIEDLEKDRDGLKDYASFVRSNAEFRYRKQQQKLIFATILLSVYLVFALGFLFIFRNNSPFLLWPFQSSNSQEIYDLQKKVNSLASEVSTVKTNISTSSGSSVLSSRISALEQSINLDPEKAVTAILIRDQQKNLETNFKELKDSQVRLEGKVDGFITSVIIVPIVGFLLALLAWFVQVRLSRKEK